MTNTQNSGFVTPDEVEAAFYDAFHRCDRNAMNEVWADEDVICIHPGSHEIVGHAAVMHSWAQIFSNAGLPEIQVKVIRKSIDVTLAVHVVEERIAMGDHSYALVLATNVYQKYKQGWLMVEHHGSLIHADEEAHTLQ